MRIAIVHYHLRPGGVTRVIRREAEALASAGENAVLLSGLPPEGGEDRSGVSVRVIGGLDYGGRGDAAPEGLAPRLRDAARDALGGRPDVWHIHNHALGKNPALTAAVARMAADGEALLLHLHDFAEDGRPAQYRALVDAGLAGALYPQAGRVHYAVLNRRDRDLLLEAGVAPERTHLLPDPVALGPVPSRAPPSRPRWLYPVRPIRRKNLGEFLLWAAVRPDAGFAVTLAPTQPADLDEYRKWRELAAACPLPVQFEVGIGGPPLEELLAGSTAAVTTSVAEGFGLAFLEPWLAGRAVVGRDLPEITADFRSAGVDLGGMYGRLDIPVDGLDVCALFAGVHHARAQLLAAYGRHPAGEDEMRLRAAMIRDGGIDFGMLDEDRQRDIVRRLARDPSSAPRLPALTPPEAAQVEANRRLIEREFSSEAHACRLRAVLRQVAGSPRGDAPPAAEAVLLDRFLDPARFRMLRT